MVLMVVMQRQQAKSTALIDIDHRPPCVCGTRGPTDPNQWHGAREYGHYVPKASAWGLGLVLRNTSCLPSLSSRLGAREYPSRRPEQPARPTLTQLSPSLSRPATLDHGSYILREPYPPVDQPLLLPSEWGIRDRESERGRGGRYPAATSDRSAEATNQRSIEASLSLLLSQSLSSLSLPLIRHSFPRLLPRAALPLSCGGHLFPLPPSLSRADNLGSLRVRSRVCAVGLPRTPSHRTAPHVKPPPWPNHRS